MICISRRKKVTQKEVCEGLRRLAFGEITDAVSLLFESDESIMSSLPRLDLFNVSEIKRAKGGGMEIKFVDRLKALDKLSELACADESKGATSFYDALERSAVKTNDSYKEDYYE